MTRPMKLTVDIESRQAPGKVHRAGATGIVVESLGPDAWLVEVRVPDDALEGGAWYETLEVRPHEFEPSTDVKWRRRDRADGDPIWEASLGDFRLLVTVACEWCWEWEIHSTDEDDIARGTVYAGGDDDDGDDLDNWDYQHVERPQKRCEAVARALASQIREAD